MNEYQTIIKNWKKQGNKIVFTNGCFDILHKGHVDYLREAKKLGDKLIVGLNSDISVRKLNKGKARPLQDEASRKAVLEALKHVDLVILFDEETPERLIRQIRPDVLVKGGDYTVNQIAGSEFVLQNGGEVKIIPLTEGYSTSAIEQKIIETFGKS